MRTSLEALCHAFIRNRDAVKAGFVWENAYLYPICASILCDAGETADIEKMKTCRALLKENTGAFSDFRGTALLATVAMLSTDADPEGHLSRALRLYGMFRTHFWCSQFLPVAAMMLSETVEESRYADLAVRTRAIYDLMKRAHPFLTSSEDSVFAAMLALSEERDSDVILETERCYKFLGAEFFSSNALQSLSHVLALSEGRAEEKCEKTIALYRALKERGYKYGTGYELPTLGVLALLPADRETVITDLCETDDFLETQKGYRGIFGMTARQRLMHAGMIVSTEYRRGAPEMGAAALGGTVALIAAQQAAMLAAIAAASAASSGAN